MLVQVFVCFCMFFSEVLGQFTVELFLCVVMSLIVNSIAVSCLERPVSKVTCYVFSGTLTSSLKLTLLPDTIICC